MKLLSRVLRVLALLSILGIFAASAVGWWSWKTLHQPFGEPSEVAVDIPVGDDAAKILRSLEARRVLANAELARLYLIHVLEDPSLKAGEYRFQLPLTTPEVLYRLMRGEVVTHRVTLIEGLTLEEAADSLAAAGFGRREAFLSRMMDPGPIADLDPEATTLEGYLFPDTYAFARGTSEAAIVETLVATFRARYQAQLQPLVSPDVGVRKLVTLASIIEKEAQLDEERPLISSVFSNRLSRGIPLAADPTVIFALKRSGSWDGNLRRADLKVDSPYNTYVVAGLPPGPICSPGLSSLQAAAAPAESPYLYFVSRNDGSHVFARTLSEHNRNVERWQKRYWRDRWARERREAQKQTNGD